MDTNREIPVLPNDIVQEVMKKMDFNNLVQLTSKEFFFKHRFALCTEFSKAAIVQQTKHMHFWQHQDDILSRTHFAEMQTQLAFSQRKANSDLLHKLYYFLLSCKNELSTLSLTPLAANLRHTEFVSESFLALLSFIHPKCLAEFIQSLLLKEDPNVFEIVANIPLKYFGKHAEEMGKLILREFVAKWTITPKIVSSDMLLGKMLERYWPCADSDSFILSDVFQKFLLFLTTKLRKTDCSKLQRNIRRVLRDTLEKSQDLNLALIHKDALFCSPPSSPKVFALRQRKKQRSSPSDNQDCLLLLQNMLSASEKEILNLLQISSYNLVNQGIVRLEHETQMAIFLKLFLTWKTADSGDKALVHPLIVQYCPSFDESLQNQLFQELERALDQHIHSIEHSTSQMGKADDARNIVYMCTDILVKDLPFSLEIAGLLSAHFAFFAEHYPNLALHILQCLEKRIPQMQYQDLVLHFLPKMRFSHQKQSFENIAYLKHLVLEEYPLLLTSTLSLIYKLEHNKKVSKALLSSTLLEIACIKGLDKEGLRIVENLTQSLNDPYFRLAFEIVKIGMQKNQEAPCITQNSMLGFTPTITL